jgi:L-threonylcarbamoyladenylate synthase
MRVIAFGDEAAQLAALPDVTAHLRAGGLIAYPTETVFGLGGLAQPLPTRRLAELKARDAAKPFILLITRAGQVAGLEWTPAARKLAEELWPGPVTLVLRDPDGRYPPGVVSRDGGVAIRETPHAGVRRLIEALNEPLTLTSANRPGGRPAVSAEEARALLRDLPARADVWLLDGPAGGAEPSTVVDCTAPRPRVLRTGAVPIERIREIVHDVEA